MKLFITYTRMEIKRGMKGFPYMVAGAAVLMIFIGTVVFCGQKMLYEKEESTRLQLGGVLLEDDKFMKMAARMLESMESVQTFCDVTYYYEEEKAMEALKSGKLDVLIVLHEGYYEEIIKGIDNPICIYLSDRAVDSVELFRMMSDTGSKILSTAQISSVAAGEYCESHELGELVREVMRAVDDKNMQMFFKREVLFQVKETTATGKLTALEYYMVAAVALFLLLIGISCIHFAVDNPIRIEEKLLRENMSYGGIVLAKWSALTLLYLCLVVPLLFLLKILLQYYGKSDILLQWNSIVSLLIVIILTTSIILFISETVNHVLSGVMGLFLVTLVCTYISGGFVPLSFLPDKIAAISEYMPVKIMMNLSVPLLTGEGNGADMGKGIVYCGIFYGGTILAKMEKQRRRYQ